MKKYIILAIIILGALASGCMNAINESNSMNNAEVNVSQSNIELVDETSEHVHENAIGDDEKKYDGMTVKSFEELKSLNTDDKEGIKSLCGEASYFVPSNVPKDMELESLDYGQAFCLATYTKKGSDERYELCWWVIFEQEKYINSLKDELSYLPGGVEKKVINNNGIDYYCSFHTLSSEPSDDKKEVKYTAEISWVEDGKCMFMRYVSAEPLDDRVLDYCQFEKYSLD